MDGRFSREISLLGEESFNTLANAHVLVIGVGGVGGYAVETLARAGIGKLTLCDGDRVDVSNINRQIIALSSTVGKFKCDVMRDRIMDINPNCQVSVYNKRFNIDSASEMLDYNYDYIVDAIDSMADKVDLIVEAQRRGIPIISAMGAGNRFALSDFEVEDIFKTSYDGLAKKLRKLLRDNGIAHHKVVYTKSSCIKSEGVIGSISYMPPLCGIKLGAEVIRCLIENTDRGMGKNIID